MMCADHNIEWAALIVQIQFLFQRHPNWMEPPLAGTNGMMNLYFVAAKNHQHKRETKSDCLN